MIAIPNMDKPKSCDECPIRIAELFGTYYKDGKSKKITITGCDSSKYNGKTIAEEEKMMYEHCPLIDIVTCGECKHRDPEDKKCDCGMFERQGCIFPVADDYFCKYGEPRGSEYVAKD